ncbi:MAG: Smr/MutS family protein [Bradyrhizobiaceae bacterium]|nr:Smr/MutS family protein [Bradyrhizobiaceae bacterium]
MSERRPPRNLSAGDRALWEEIKKSIKPLRGRKTKIPAVESEEEPPAPKPKSGRAAAPASAPVAPKDPPPLANLDRRTRQRIARGRVEIDARLDLHGMTLERARTRLATFLATAQARGDALVLVITGKGSGGGQGALRREVPHWLALPEFRALVIGFEEATASHGGAGALYVRVRRARL